ncbi:MAG: hypothetical protein WA055_01785 [Candidatus Moraniibacteriota bacterium]
MKNFPFEGSVPKSIDKPNSLKSEHLKEDVKPILVCAGKPDNFKDSLLSDEKILKLENPSKTMHVDFSLKSVPDLIKRGYGKSGEVSSYVISEINNFDKISKGFVNCTGVIIAGKDKETGEDISILSHQYPKYFLSDEIKKKKFLDDLNEKIYEIKERSERNSIDAVIFGGNYIKDKEDHKKNYLNSISLLSKEISTILGFEPVVISGPKTGPAEEHIYYINDDRKLYLFKTEVDNKSSEPFLPSDIKKQEEKWME